MALTTHLTNIPSEHNIHWIYNTKIIMMKTETIYAKYDNLGDIPSDEFIKLIEDEISIVSPPVAEIMNTLLYPNCFGVAVADYRTLSLMSNYSPENWDDAFLDSKCVQEFYRDHFEAIEKVNAHFDFDEKEYASKLDEYFGASTRTPRYILASLHAIETVCGRVNMKILNQVLKEREARKKQKNKGIKR